MSDSPWHDQPDDIIEAAIDRLTEQVKRVADALEPPKAPVAEFSAKAAVRDQVAEIDQHVRRSHQNHPFS